MCVCKNERNRKRVRVCKNERERDSVREIRVESETKNSNASCLNAKKWRGDCFDRALNLNFCF